MKFEARELKGYAEPVLANSLQIGRVYFSVQFLDEDLLIPSLEPLLFLGRNLLEESADRLYFQTLSSYQGGVRLRKAAAQFESFQIGHPDSFKHVFEFDRALDVLLMCSLQRINQSSDQITVQPELD